MKTTIHAICTIILGLFFIFKGIDKLPIKLKEVTQEQIISTIVEKESYEAPVGYRITMNTMRQSGFIRLISLFQILAGVLMIIPRTRLTGLLILLPIIFISTLWRVEILNRLLVLRPL